MSSRRATWDEIFGKDNRLMGLNAKEFKNIF